MQKQLPPRPPSRARHNRGVALITAVLITGIVAITAATMLSRQHLDIRRTANAIDGDRAYVFALGVESWVRGLLWEDRQIGETDNLNEDWALSLPPIEVEGAMVSGHIEDLQGRFNINNLVTEGKPSELDMTRFKRLLAVLEITTDFSQAVVDWIDVDADTSFPDGGEDSEYMQGPIPRRPANQPLASPSELLLIKGVTADIYQQIAPFISALPQRTAINVNTAPEQVLMILADEITYEDVSKLIETREDEPFANVDDFLRHEVLAGRRVEKEGLAVASEFFLVDAATQFGRGHTRLFSVIDRKASEINIVMRGQGAY